MHLSRYGVAAGSWHGTGTLTAVGIRTRMRSGREAASRSALMRADDHAAVIAVASNVHVRAKTDVFGSLLSERGFGNGAWLARYGGSLVLLSDMLSSALSRFLFSFSAKALYA